MRAFIAIPIPQNIRNLAVGLQEKLAGLNADVKWVEDDNYHITLKFLGEINHDTVENICRYLDTITSHTPNFELRTSKIGFFPNFKHPRVVWLGITGDLHKANYLGEQIDNYLVADGFKAEQRRSFHLTLGRIRSGKGREKLVERSLELNKGLKEIAFTANKLNLIESQLFARGPIYKTYKSFQFEG